MSSIGARSWRGLSGATNAWRESSDVLQDNRARQAALSALSNELDTIFVYEGKLPSITNTGELCLPKLTERCLVCDELYADWEIHKQTHHPYREPFWLRALRWAAS